MGCFSRYCGISNITIGDGDPCCIIPLKKTTQAEYARYLPCTLPIFGKYDDYGSIDNIIRDENVLLLESYFETEIEAILDVILDQRDYRAKYNDKLVDYFEDTEFMFIHKDVYDFCSSIHPNSEPGHFDLGNENFLQFIGAKYLGEDKLEERYQSMWDINGKQFNTDGTWLHLKDNKGIYNFNMFYEYFNLDSKHEWLKNTDDLSLYKIYGLKFIYDRILSIFDIKFYARMDLNPKNPMYDYYIEEFNNHFKGKEIVKMYFDETNLDKFIEDIIKLKRLQRNIYCFSGEFMPTYIYATPQCPEHDYHKLYMNKFTEIIDNNLKKYN